MWSSLGRLPLLKTKTGYARGRGSSMSDTDIDDTDAVVVADSDSDSVDSPDAGDGFRLIRINVSVNEFKRGDTIRANPNSRVISGLIKQGLAEVIG